MKNSFISKLKNVDCSNLVVIIGGINILLALLAVLKDMVMASYFGTTTNADAFTLSFFITDMLGNNLIANAAAVSSIPLFTKIYMDKNEKSLYENLLYVNVLFLSLTATSVLTIFLLRNVIISNGDTKVLCIRLLMILLPTILLYPVVTTGISYLQVRGKFIISSLASVVFNFIFLIGISYCLFFKIPVSKGIFVVTFSVLSAVVAMVALIYLKIIKDKKRYIVETQINRVKDVTIFKLFMPYAIILLLSQLVLYYERYLASYFQGGSVAALNYAYRLSQFPIWVFVAAITTVLFPIMAKHNSEGDFKSLNEVFKKALLWVFMLTMPVAFIFYILREPILSILFLRGAFDDSSLKITSEILAGYSFAIISQSISALCLKVYLAREEVKIPLIIFIFSSIINVILDGFLVNQIGIDAVGYGAAVSSIINAIIMLLMIKLDIRHGFHESMIKFSKCLIANSMLVLLCVFSSEMWTTSIAKMNVLAQLTYMGAVVLLGGALYVLSLKFLKVF